MLRPEAGMIWSGASSPEPTCVANTSRYRCQRGTVPPVRRRLEGVGQVGIGVDGERGE